jgi:hypothetical protein
MLSLFTFGNKDSKTIETQILDVGLQLKNSEHFVIQANVVPQITGRITSASTIDIDKIISSYTNLEIAKGQLGITHVDLLLGNDYYFDIVSGNKIQISPGLYLIDTKFGWILSGRERMPSEAKVLSEGTNESSPQKLLPKPLHESLELKISDDIKDTFNLNLPEDDDSPQQPPISKSSTTNGDLKNEKNIEISFSPSQDKVICSVKKYPKTCRKEEAYDNIPPITRFSQTTPVISQPSMRDAQETRKATKSSD